MDTIGVGIIGVNAQRGWAREAHARAVNELGGLSLLAVAGRDQGRADAAARAVGAVRGYGDPARMIDDPNIDLVVVASPVPTHAELIETALQHGKHVVTEWPVGVDATQARLIAAAARESDVHSAVGLQARMSAGVVEARRLLSTGTIGRVHAVNVLSTTAGFGPVVAENELYLEDPANGMNLPTIQTAHTVDLATFLTGPLESFDATLDVQYPELRAGGRIERRTVADHVLLRGRFAGGATLTAEIVGGRPPGRTPFELVVLGESGEVRLTGGAPRGFQAGALSLTLDGEQVATPSPETDDLPPAVGNVARLYAALRDDIGHGTRSTPDFDSAANLAGFVEQLVGR